MKTMIKLILVAVALAISASTGLAAEKLIAGPKGGRLLATQPHRTEFYINAERNVEITFYDVLLKPVAPGTQVVAVTAEPASGRTALEMERTATGYRSTSPLPPSNVPYRIVVQVRPQAAATPQNFRVDLNLTPCAECTCAEYACICGH